MMNIDLLGFRFPTLTALALACLTPAVANAQYATEVETLSIRGLDSDEVYGGLPTGTDRNIIINIENCVELMDDPTDEITIEWTFDADVYDRNEQFVVKFDPGSISCDTDSLSNEEGCELMQTSDTLNGLVSETLTATEIAGADVVTDDDCFIEANEVENSIAIVFEQRDASDDIEIKYDQVNFFVELGRPGSPTDITVEPGEQNVAVEWDEVSGAAYYEVYVSSTVGDLTIANPELSSESGERADGTRLVVDGLSVDNTYYAAVVAVDDNGNRSAFSASTEFITVPSNDFWESYRNAGGVEEGGCSAANGAAGGAMLLMAFALLGLRRGRWAMGAVAVMIALPSTASADLRYGDPHTSDITSAFELKLGVYRPDIDEEFSGDGPYEDIFGERTPLLIEAEYSRQFYRGVGSLGWSVSMGWSQIKGNALADDGTEANDITRLRILPFRTGLVYRFDYLQERWNVPLAFSFKAGLDYYAWFVRSSAGIADVDGPDGERLVGRGGTTGYHIGVGAFFLLDFLAPRMASEFDANAGVNNTYLFAELLMAKVNDFGGDSSWDLSDTTVQFGLAFEF